MKKLTICLLLVLTALAGFSQPVPTAAPTGKTIPIAEEVVVELWRDYHRAIILQQELGNKIDELEATKTKVAECRVALIAKTKEASTQALLTQDAEIKT